MRQYHYINQGRLEANVLLRCLQSSGVIILLYAFYDFYNHNFLSVINAGIALLLYIICYALMIYTHGSSASKRVVVILFMLSVTSEVFILGGLQEIASLDIASFMVVIAVVFSGTERRFFIITYALQILVLAWIQVFHNEWIINSRSNDPLAVNVAEVLARICHMLYIGSLYKSEFDKERIHVLETNEKLEEANSEISAHDKYVTAYNEQMRTLVAKLEKEQAKVSEMNYRLADMNAELNRNNKLISSVNEMLEGKIAQRTQGIKDLNKKMAEYAAFNSHKVRAPVARILGLIYVMTIDLDNSTISKEKFEFYMDKLLKSASELDHIVKEINILLSTNEEFMINDQNIKIISL